MPDRPAIAVLPFTNMSGEPEQEYFSDGISEDIITALSKVRWFLVIARNSSFVQGQVGASQADRRKSSASAMCSKAACAKAASACASPLSSSMCRPAATSGPSATIAISPTSSRCRMRLPKSIVASIEPQIYRRGEFPRPAKAPDSLDAWDLVMRALSHYWRVTRQDYVVAQALLEKAISIDPNYAQALGVLATSHMFCVHLGWAETMTGDGGRGARRSFGDPRRQRGRLGALSRSDTHFSSGARFDDSLAEFELAVRLNANFSMGQGYYGLALAYCGRWQEGNEAALRAIRLSPRDPLCRRLLRHRGLRAVCRPQLRRSDQAVARRRCASAAISSARIVC